MSMIRTFIALDLPRSVQQSLGQLQEEFRGIHAPVSWVKSHSIHITLKFLGNISLEQIPAIQTALEEIALSTSPFHLQGRGCGAFPSLKRMRVVWVGLRGDDKPLQELQKQVETAMVQLGFQPEDRPFRPHLTIGRVKGKGNFRLLQEAMIAQNTFQTEAFDVNEIVLYKSELKPGGAQYTSLFRATFENNK
jgi:2'-5' RNA ligase